MMLLVYNTNLYGEEKLMQTALCWYFFLKPGIYLAFLDGNVLWFIT